MKTSKKAEVPEYLLDYRKTAFAFWDGSLPPSEAVERIRAFARNSWRTQTERKELICSMLILLDFQPDGNFWTDEMVEPFKALPRNAMSDRMLRRPDPALGPGAR